MGNGWFSKAQINLAMNLAEAKNLFGYSNFGFCHTSSNFITKFEDEKKNNKTSTKFSFLQHMYLVDVKIVCLFVMFVLKSLQNDFRVR